MRLISGRARDTLPVKPASRDHRERRRKGWARRTGTIRDQLVAEIEGLNGNEGRAVGAPGICGEEHADLR
jgi:hypothetical protein